MGQKRLYAALSTGGGRAKKYAKYLGYLNRSAERRSLTRTSHSAGNWWEMLRGSSSSAGKGIEAPTPAIGLDLMVLDANAANVVASSVTSERTRVQILDQFRDNGERSNVETVLGSVFTTGNVNRSVEVLRGIARPLDERARRTKDTKQRKLIRRAAGVTTGFKALEYGFKFGIMLRNAARGNPQINADRLESAWRDNMNAAIDIVIQQSSRKGSLLEGMPIDSERSLKETLKAACSDQAGAVAITSRLDFGAKGTEEFINKLSGLYASIREELLGQNPYIRLASFLFSVLLEGAQVEATGFRANIPGLPAVLAEHGAMRNGEIREVLGNRRQEKEALSRRLVSQGVDIDARTDQLERFERETEEIVNNMGRGNCIYSLVRRTNDNNCDVMYRGTIKREMAAAAAENPEVKIRRGTLLEKSQTLTSLRQRAYEQLIRPNWEALDGANDHGELRTALRNLIANRTGQTGWGGMIRNFLSGDIDTAVSNIYDPSFDNMDLATAKLQVLDRVVGAVEDTFEGISI